MYASERITDQSYNDIKKLYQLSFNLDYTLSSIKKKYATDPFGLKNVGIVAKDENGSPAAYYGVFPITLTYKNKDYVIAQSGDTMTALNHRKKGLFTRLAKETYQLSKDLGIHLIYGFPNQNSYPGFKHKLNWVFSGEMQKFSIKVNTIPFCEVVSKFNFLEPLYTTFAKFRLKKHLLKLASLNYDEFNVNYNEGLVNRDVNYFTYKLNKSDRYFINYKGFQLLIKTKPHLIIGEVGFFKKEDTDKFIQTIKKLAKILACRQIIFTLSKNHWLFSYLEKELTYTKNLPIGFYKINPLINHNEIQFSGADYDTF